ncbi:AAA family ATPase [Pseudomonas palleroniana]|uniref:AAA family ATPase n=1 Tax=Pseudomonas palleroniana TaxID=191390 RepID=UPI003B001F60
MDIPLISSIYVEKLFGLYCYRLPETGALTNASILYGDNGVGKSTILRLVFHLLSSATDRGHRNALYNAPFGKIEVLLDSGVLLSAAREVSEDGEFYEGLNKGLILTVHKDMQLLGEWFFDPEKRNRAEYGGHGDISQGVSNESFNIEWVHNIKRNTFYKKGSIGLGDSASYVHSKQAYIDALAAHAPTMFILNADRRLDCDAVSDPSDEVELRRVMRFEEPKRINDLVVRSREIALSQALNSAAKWVSAKTLQSVNLGAENVHTVYVNVLKHLVSTSSSDTEEAVPKTEELLRLIAEIEAKTAELSVYGLAAPLSLSEFRKSLSARARPKRVLAAGLLKPYLDSLKGRIEAVIPIYTVLHRFILVVNDFLTDKDIEYKVGSGFRIVSAHGGTPLDAGNLSSGEQQLLLLFCYVLTGRDKACVFMIDEPEISLNIKWQRKLVRTLLEVTEGANIQFVFASHSIELLAQHKDRVIKVVNKNGQ